MFVHCLTQEFDNYAEWDLKGIDFVDDDSDILRGGSNLNSFWGAFDKEKIKVNHMHLLSLIVSCVFFCFSTQALSC